MANTPNAAAVLPYLASFIFFCKVISASHCLESCFYRMSDFARNGAAQLPSRSRFPCPPELKSMNRFANCRFASLRSRKQCHNSIHPPKLGSRQRPAVHGVLYILEVQHRAGFASRAAAQSIPYIHASNASPVQRRGRRPHLFCGPRPSVRCQ